MADSSFEVAGTGLNVSFTPVLLAEKTVSSETRSSFTPSENLTNYKMLLINFVEGGYIRGSAIAHRKNNSYDNILIPIYDGGSLARAIVYNDNTVSGHGTNSQKFYIYGICKDV